MKNKTTQKKQKLQYNDFDGSLLLDQKSEQIYENLKSASLIGDFQTVKNSLEYFENKFESIDKILNPKFNEESLLHMSLFSENDNVAELLVKKGAKIDAIDQYGDTPLHYAAAFRRKDALRLLIDNGSDINLKNTKGFTPIQSAAMNGNIESVEMLAKSGAKFEYNKAGMQAIKIASENGHVEVSKYLEKNKPKTLLTQVNGFIKSSIEAFKGTKKELQMNSPSQDQQNNKKPVATIIYTDNPLQKNSISALPDKDKKQLESIKSSLNGDKKHSRMNHILPQAEKEQELKTVKSSPNNSKNHSRINQFLPKEGKNGMGR